MQWRREVFCGSQVKQILIEGEGDAARAVGVKLADGRVFRGRTVVSNATRWDTFENLLGERDMPEAEQLFRCFLVPAPRRCVTKPQAAIILFMAKLSYITPHHRA